MAAVFCKFTLWHRSPEMCGRRERTSGYDLQLWLQNHWTSNTIDVTPDSTPTGASCRDLLKQKLRCCCNQFNSLCCWFPCYKRCKHVWEWVHAHFCPLHLPNMDVEQEASIFLLQRKCAKKFRLLQQSGCGRCGFFACWILFRHVCWLTKPPEGWCGECDLCLDLGSSVLI